MAIKRVEGGGGARRTERDKERVEAEGKRDRQTKYILETFSLFSFFLKKKDSAYMYHFEAMQDKALLKSVGDT